MIVKLNGIDIPVAKNGVSLSYIKDYQSSRSTNRNGFSSGVSLRRVVELETTIIPGLLANNLNSIVLGDHHLVNLSKGLDTDTGIKRIFNIDGIGFVDIGQRPADPFFSRSPSVISGTSVAGYSIRSKENNCSILAVGQFADGEVVNLSATASPEDGEKYTSASGSGGLLYTVLNSSKIPNANGLPTQDSLLMAVGLFGTSDIKFYSFVLMPYEVDDYILSRFIDTDGIWPGAGSVVVNLGGEEILCEGEVSSMSMVESPGEIKYTCKYRFQEVGDERFID